ncbi:hypothetical protein ACTG4Q_21060 [Bradyrhizobium denitrificans]
MVEFKFRHGLREHSGFKIGQRVTMLEQGMGCDHDDVEHTLPAGSDGLIDTIEMLPAPQGLTFTIWIPVDEADDRGIVNVFDQGDGPITNFITAKETP